MSITKVRLRPKVEKGLESLARKLNRSKEGLINEVLTEYLERKELEETRWQETIAAMESVTNGTVVPADGVHEWLRSRTQRDGSSVLPLLSQ